MPQSLDNETALVARMTMLGYPVRYEHKVQGPIVTTYFFTPAGQQPISKILARTEDLAMACGVESVIVKRELAQIVVEVPNKERQLVRFDECLHWLATSEEPRMMALPMLMGMHTNGERFALDLAAQPHVLIAGSTGSGKSVFLAELISSLAVLKSKRELQLILVDTKKLDLTLFEKLPHCSDLVTTVEDMHTKLSEVERLIRRRAELMRSYARNVSEWNWLHRDSANTSAAMPYIVIVIDELADIIDQDRALARLEDKDNRRVRIETKLKTITQISRAAGVHIIAATQRPSVKVINGDIKTNFPTRISFKLAATQDSRTVLGEQGAESLLGKGDYLYQHSGSDSTTRAHGAFVSMADISMVVEQSDMIRQQYAQVSY